MKKQLFLKVLIANTFFIPDQNVKAQKNIRVFRNDLPDTRMQNIAVLSAIISNSLIEGMDLRTCEKAMTDLMPEKLLKINLEILKS